MGSCRSKKEQREKALLEIFVFFAPGPGLSVRPMIGTVLDKKFLGGGGEALERWSTIARTGGFGDRAESLAEGRHFMHVPTVENGGASAAGRLPNRGTRHAFGIG